MMCNPGEFREDDRRHVALQGVQTEPYEGSQATFAERVCEFLERYAIAHFDDAKSQGSATAICGAIPKSG
jgi:hypothetical protein